MGVPIIKNMETLFYTVSAYDNNWDKVTIKLIMFSLFYKTKNPFFHGGFFKNQISKVHKIIWVPGHKIQNKYIHYYFKFLITHKQKLMK